MKTVLSLLPIVGFNSFAMAQERPLHTLINSAAMPVLNDSDKSHLSFSFVRANIREKYQIVGDIKLVVSRR